MSVPEAAMFLCVCVSVSLSLSLACNLLFLCANSDTLYLTLALPHGPQPPISVQTPSSNIAHKCLIGNILPSGLEFRGLPVVQWVSAALLQATTMLRKKSPWRRLEW